MRNPIAVRSLTPDIPAPWTIDTYRAGRDPAMEAVAEPLLWVVEDSVQPSILRRPPARQV